MKQLKISKQAPKLAIDIIDNFPNTALVISTDIWECRDQRCDFTWT